jgi:hypothetical protein
MADASGDGKKAEPSAEDEQTGLELIVTDGGTS